MRIFSIAWKDFRQTYRNVAGLAMMIIAPVVLATALGAAFGSGDNFSISPVRTVVVNEDKGVAPTGQTGSQKVIYGDRITEVLGSQSVSKLLTVQKGTTAQAARASVNEGNSDVAVIIPAGFSQAVNGRGTAGGQVTIYHDPSLTVGPSIVNSIVASVVQEIDGARAAAATAAQLAVAERVTDQARISEVANKAAQSFVQKAQNQAAVTLNTRSPAAAAVAGRPEPNVASQVLLGMMIFFMFFGAAIPARSILEEHRIGTLSRLFTTPTPRSMVLAGKYVSVFVVVLVQSVILLLIGQLLMGAHWGAIGPVIALVLCGAMVATSLGLVTVSFAKTPGQAGAVGSAIFVFLGLIGGNFFGGQDISGTFDVVRKLTPNGWLLQGWNRVIFGGSWSSMYVPLLVSLAYAVVLFAIATLFFRRRYA
jgi:ABC-2 type transport system permease protein